MNENIEKNNQDNKENPADASASTEAFKWDYTEPQKSSESAEKEAPVSEGTPAAEEETPVAEGTPTAEKAAATEDAPVTEDASHMAENKTEEYLPDDYYVDYENECGAIETDPKKAARAKKRFERRLRRYEKQAARHKRRYSTKALVKESNIAKLLSAVSILLLATVTVLLLLGIIPTDNRIVYVQVSNLGPVGTAPGDASSELIEDFKNSVVIVTVKTKNGGATGSGIVITEDGYIATNYHVVDDAVDISITLYNSKEKIPARLMGYSERDDIAVLKANVDGLRPATFARSESCRVGERVYSVGAPEGEEFGWTVTQGIISNPLREIKIYDNEYILEKKMYLLQTDAAVNPGNSGGPLINARGEVVGIITLKRSDSAGIGFALPSSASLELIDAIIRNGNIDGVTSRISRGRPLIGIVGVGLEADVWYEQTADGVRKVDKEYASLHPDVCIITDVPGVYVTSLNPELDASNHLKVGDVITEVNGEAIYITYDIMDVVNEFNGGDSVTVKYVRGGKTYTAEILLIEEK